MSDSAREQVLGYLLGALDDAEMEQVAIAAGVGRKRTAASFSPCAGRWQRSRPPRKSRRAVRAAAGIGGADLRNGLRPGQAVAAGVLRGPAISPLPAPPSSYSRPRWIDATVAAAVFLVAAALTFPAIHSSRFRARLTVCSDNLREMGVALTGYSRANHDYFPRVPTEGKMASAGIYAPTLLPTAFSQTQGGYVAPIRRWPTPAGARPDARRASGRQPGAGRRPSPADGRKLRLLHRLP